MPFERSEHEPEEYDPEAEFRDPDSDALTIPEIGAPDVAAPEIEIPAVETDEIDVPGPIQRDFWLLVIVLKVAVLVSALGVMLFAFGYDRSYWAPCVLAGLALFALSARRYRGFRDLVDRIHDDTGESATDGEAMGPDATASDATSPPDSPSGPDR